MVRNSWMKQSRQENIIYLVVWGLLFAAPLLSLYVRTASDDNVVFEWTEVFFVWHKFAVFLLLFLVHNFLLAPLLVHQRKRIAYFSIVVALLAAFSVYQCNSPERGPKMHRLHMDRAGHHQGADVHGIRKQQPPFDEPPMSFDGERPPMPNDVTPPSGKRWPQGFERPKDRHPLLVDERHILAIVMLILMFAANLGVKNYFRTRDDRKRLAELEKRNLEQQLEYLRYQINPHFFMNTLNNIHALVDIDQEKAKDTILEL